LTNDIGTYRKYVPAGFEYEVAIDGTENHGMFSYPVIAPALSELETGVHNIQLASACPSTIRGRLTDDKGQPIPGRLAYLTQLGDVNISASFDGTFEMHLPPHTTVALEGMSWVCANTKMFTVESGAQDEMIDVGDLQLCGIEKPSNGDIDVSSFEGTVSAALSSDGSMMGIMGADPLIVIRDGENGALIRDIPHSGSLEAPFVSPRFSAAGNRLMIQGLTAGLERALVFETSNGTFVRQFDGLRSTFLMPDGQSIIGVRYDLLAESSELVLYSIATGDLIETYSLDDAQVGEFTVLGVTDDGSRAVLATLSTVIVFELATDAMISQAPCFTSGVVGESMDERSISSDGSRLAKLNGNGAVEVIETATGAVLYTIASLDISWYGGMKLHPNGKWLLVQKKATGGVQPPPVFIDVATGLAVRELTTEGDPGIFYQYSFSKDGSRAIGLYRNEDLTRTKIRTWNL
jgi:hypothetical protein